MRIRITSLRPGRFDELGLRHTVTDRIVPFLVAAMAFLAALAIAGWIGSTALIGHWESGTGSALTVQIPNPTEPDAAMSGTRLSTAQAVLMSTPGVESVKILSNEELDALLRPWLEANMKNLAMQTPTVIAIHMRRKPNELLPLDSQLAEKVPGTILEDQEIWTDSMALLARTLQLCSGLVLLIVTFVTVAVIVVATHFGLASRRDMLLIVYQLGATDGYIVHRFSSRVATLASIGGMVGGLLALPVVFTLAVAATPLAGTGALPLSASAVFGFLPLPLWLLPFILPQLAAMIGYLATQITMRRWLRQLSYANRPDH
jgi:cell division transport system permease protein